MTLEEKSHGRSQNASSSRRALSITEIRLVASASLWTSTFSRRTTFAIQLRIAIVTIILFVLQLCMMTAFDDDVDFFPLRQSRDALQVGELLLAFAMLN